MTEQEYQESIKTGIIIGHDYEVPPPKVETTREDGLIKYRLMGCTIITDKNGVLLEFVNITKNPNVIIFREEILI